MRTITVTKEITLYSADDLALEKYSDIRKRVIEKYQDWTTDHDWDEFLYEHEQVELEKLGFFNIKLGFTGFYCQGEGAYIEASIDFDGACKIMNVDNKYKTIDFNNIKVYQYGRYCHEETMELLTEDFHWTGTGKESDWLVEHLNNHCEYVREGILEYLKRRARKLYVILEQEYDYLTSEDGILENLADYEFTANGEMYDEI